MRAFPTNAATWAAVTWVFRLAKGNQLPGDYYETLSDMIERTKVENMLATSVARLPDMLYKNQHPLYLINNEILHQKFFIQNVRAESRTVDKGNLENSINKEKTQEKQEKDSVTDSKDDDCTGKKVEEFRPKSIRLQHDETTKSKIYKCEKEISSLETFFVSLCKITSKSFS